MHQVDDGQLYVKKKGRYISTSDPWAYTGLQQGHWHVWVRPGTSTMRASVWPARTEVAAMLEAEDAMVEAMMDADRARPPKIPMTKRHQKAWAQYVKDAGDDAFSTLTRASTWDIVQAGITALKRAKYGEALT